MLDGVLTTERDIFSPGASEAYWRDYQNPDYRSALHDVDVYRLAYRTTIPEQGNRPTVAYGLVAIPRGVSGQIPVVSYQHGSLWLKESAPSQAFSWDVTSTAVVNYGLTEQELCLSAYETRLNVAQFAGQGYAVVAADYIGIGNSVENDAFFVKQSGQQACLDMLAASERLLASRSLFRSDLFLNGWSQGGIATVAFQEALEARGVRISGVSTSSAGPDTNQFVTQSIFNRRPYSTVTVPDAPWRVFVPQFSAFSLGGYHGQVNTPLELLGGNYEVSRKFYMREFKSPPSFAWQINVRGEMVPVFIQDGVTTTAEVSRFIDQKAARDPRAFEQTAYAGLFQAAGSGKTRLVSDMRMYYGDQDEAGPEAVATSIATWQRGTFGKTNIEMVKVPYASHRRADRVVQRQTRPARCRGRPHRDAERPRDRGDAHVDEPGDQRLAHHGLLGRVQARRRHGMDQAGRPRRPRASVRHGDRSDLRPTVSVPGVRVHRKRGPWVFVPQQQPRRHGQPCPHGHVRGDGPESQHRRG
jgi:hypothetical protein